jgi:hypothetical protein
VQIFNPLLSKVGGDAMFIATKNTFNIEDIEITDDVLIKGALLSEYEVPISSFDNSLATVLTDDKNNTDALLKSHYFNVRESIRKELAKLESN